MHLFFSAGEPSGDQHAAHVIHALRQRVPSLRCSGFGGPEMQRAGQNNLFELTNLAVMGVGGVIPLLSTFRDLYAAAVEFFRSDRPDAVVLVDFPGFNWWVARAAKKAGVPVYFYCPPQLWAWAPWRIHKMRRLVDGVLSVLPFEAEWYRARGMDVSYVGHPFFDEVAEKPLSPEIMGEIRSAGEFTLGVLPGSRKQEVNANFPIMLHMIDELHRKHPGVSFPIACYKPWHRDRCARLLSEYPVELPVELITGQTSEVIEAADCCMMVSGSVSLELLARRKPAVVMYHVGPVTWWLARMLATCKYMSLPNLISDKELMPECAFLYERGEHVNRLTNTLDSWISSPRELARVRGEMNTLAESIVAVGGVNRAAEDLIQRVTAKSAKPAMRRAA